MILPVVLYGNPVLREVAKPVGKDYPKLKELIEDMFETMRNADGIGLAAPQVGLTVRVIVIDVSPVKEDYSELKDRNTNTAVLINPIILEHSGEIVQKEEGCLSLPKINEKVSRHNTIKIKYLDENFVEHIETVSGFFARIVQHEYDHIEGLVFTDRISPLRKQLIKSKLIDLTKRNVDCKYKFK
ncbi:MAG: peptide deformylase [Prevotellaceae bacterium]|jgi:peptide deformylase|nr:peptide deformylase [Prevotellaceae bacterium]